MRLAGLIVLLVAGTGSAAPYHFTFAAAQERLNTGLYVQRGERLEIDARGSWTMWAGHYGRSNADGHRYRAGIYGWGRLMARVGSGEEISIGTHKSWSSPNEGLLILYPNLGELGLRGGEGQLEIDVTGGTRVEQVIAALAKAGERVTVPADGTITDIYVEAGELITIHAFGEWRMFENGPLLPPEGDPERRLPDGTPWGHLVARVGAPGFSVGETYLVGARREIRPARSGLLELAPAVGPYAGHPRAGSLDVVVRGGRRASSTDCVSAQRESADHERSLAFLRLHQLRAALRLPDAESDPALMRAAQAHAEYAAAREGGHEELSGTPGFTGATPEARVTAAGFRGRLTAELLHGHTDGLRAIDGLWSTVYQRLPLLDPRATRYGIGVASEETTVFVLMAGIPEQPQPPQAELPAITTFPMDGQAHVPTQWSGVAQPSPLPPHVPRPVGYPISLTVTSGRLGRVISATLVDADGRPVSAHLITSESHPSPPLDGTMFLIAERPLRPNTIYRCTVALETDEGPVQHSWRFTTGLGSSPLAAEPQLGNPANPPIELGR